MLEMRISDEYLVILVLQWFRWIYTITPLVMLCWLVAGHWLRQVTAPEFTALYVAVERPVLSVLSALILLGLFNGMTGEIHFL